MAPSIENTSNEPIPDYIWALPAHLEPQPALVAPWCSNCLAGYARGGTDARGREDCSRTNIYAVCTNCAKGNKGGCVPVGFPLLFRLVGFLLIVLLQPEPQFRRAFNVLTWLIQYAKKGQAANIQNWEKRWDNVSAYATQIQKSMISYTSFMKREVKDSGLDVGKYHLARQRSREHNFQRYQV
jgi:hypothetical protein